MNKVGFVQFALFRLAFLESQYKLVFYGCPAYPRSFHIYRCTSKKCPPDRFGAQKHDKNGIFNWFAVYLGAQMPPTQDIVSELVSVVPLHGNWSLYLPSNPNQKLYFV